jgi:hypothetical protein
MRLPAFAIVMRTSQTLRGRHAIPTDDDNSDSIHGRQATDTFGEMRGSAPVGCQGREHSPKSTGTTWEADLAKMVKRAKKAMKAKPPRKGVHKATIRKPKPRPHLRLKKGAPKN